MHSFYENCDNERSDDNVLSGPDNERSDDNVLSGPDNVGFVVYTVTLEQVFLRVL
jgi:hypothetical protein